MVKAVAIEKEAEFPRVIVEFRVLGDMFSDSQGVNYRHEERFSSRGKQELRML